MGQSQSSILIKILSAQAPEVHCSRKREFYVPLDQWISDFLSKRGLQEPDGRPLFAYKTSSEEFEVLRQLLQKLPAGQNCSGLMKPDTHLGENARQIEV